MDRHRYFEKLADACNGSVSDPRVVERIKAVLLDPETPADVRRAAFNMLPPEAIDAELRATVAESPDAHEEDIMQRA